MFSHLYFVFFYVLSYFFASMAMLTEQKELLFKFGFYKAMHEDCIILAGDDQKSKNYSIDDVQPLLQPFKYNNQWLTHDNDSLFRMNLEKYNLKDLLNYWYLCDHYSLCKPLLEIVVEVALLRLYNNQSYKKSFIDFFGEEEIYIEKILTCNENNHTKSGYNNPDNDILEISRIPETAYSSCGFACNEAMISYWRLDIKQLLENLNKRNTVCRNVNGDKLFLHSYKHLFMNITQEKILALRTKEKNILDFSYFSFLTLLFNYPADFYALDKTSSCIGEKKSDGWNVKMQIASVFIRILYPQFSKNISGYYKDGRDHDYNVFDKKEFEQIETVILDYTDLTKIDLRFWANLFPNLKTLSIVGCKLNRGLSYSDKLFLAGCNVYSENNRGNLNIQIDQTQVSFIRPTYLDSVLMFLQDSFGGLSTDVDIVQDSNKKIRLTGKEKFYNSEKAMLQVNYLPYLLTIPAGLYIFLLQSRSVFLLWMGITLTCVYNAFPVFPCIDPCFGGMFGLGPKNKIWQKHLFSSIPLYFFCLIVFAYSMNLTIPSKKFFFNIGLSLLIFVFHTKSCSNPHALLHLITGKYSLDGKYTIVDEKMSLDHEKI